MDGQSKMWLLPFVVNKELEQLIIPDPHHFFMDKETDHQQVFTGKLNPV